MTRADVSITLEVPESALRIRYYHQDHLGSSTTLADSTGILVGETESYAFGYPRIEYKRDNLRESYQFTQKENDTETGLSNFEARMLASMFGRFIRNDPALTSPPADWLRNPSRMNGYLYCAGQPLMRIDPSGMEDKNILPENIHNAIQSACEPIDTLKKGISEAKDLSEAFKFDPTVGQFGKLSEINKNLKPLTLTCSYYKAANEGYSKEGCPGYRGGSWEQKPRVKHSER